MALDTEASIRMLQRGPSYSRTIRHSRTKSRRTTSNARKTQGVNEMQNMILGAVCLVVSPFVEMVPVPDSMKIAIFIALVMTGAALIHAKVKSGSGRD